jgi:hypothetical protein
MKGAVMPVKMRAMTWSAVALATAAMLVFAAADPAQAAVPIVKSSLGAGYLSHPAAWTSATAVLTVPTLTCSSPTEQHMSMGMFGLTDASAVTSQAQINLSCVNEKPVYSAETIANGHVHGKIIPVTPGDLVSVNFRKIAGTTLVVTKDLTAGTDSRARDQAVDPATNLLFGVSAPPGVPNFSETRFAPVTINGAAFGTTPVTREFLKWSTTTEIRSTILNPENNGFKVTFLHS